MKIKIKKIIAISIAFLIAFSYSMVKAVDSDFTLLVTANAKKNRVELEWRIEGEDEYTYKIYQKAEGNSEYKPISVTSFEVGSSSKVNVLNVYPEVSEKVTFKYLDGTTEELPKSAALKVWMEGGTMTLSNGTVETFDNYGRNPEDNTQIIFVTPVSMSDFNSNPDVMWNYDVIMFGTWDYNGNADLTAESAIEVGRYIDSGHGVLCGHDTLNTERANFWTLREKFKVDVTVNPSKTTNVTVVKNGTLTQFPWDIGGKGTKLVVPNTHNKQNAYGDIWMKFGDRTSGTDNFYLASYNNTGMIQTGHSDAQSTADERKVLANSLFYLNQLTTKTSSVDYSAKDLAAPDKVNAESINCVKENGQVRLSYSEARDYGTAYSYYVEATDNQNNVKKSDEKQVVLISGIKEYLVSLTENENEEGTWKVDNGVLELNSNSNYLHIKAVDYAGNQSEVTTWRISESVKETSEREFNVTGREENVVVTNTLDNTTADKKIPQTGVSIALPVAILVSITVSYVVRKKNKKYKNIKI